MLLVLIAMLRIVEEKVPFPVTVIGVTVVEARAAKTGVPLATTDEAESAKPRRPNRLFDLILKTWKLELKRNKGKDSSL